MEAQVEKTVASPLSESGVVKDVRVRFPPCAYASFEVSGRRQKLDAQKSVHYPPLNLRTEVVIGMDGMATYRPRRHLAPLAFSPSLSTIERGI